MVWRILCLQSSAGTQLCVYCLLHCQKTIHDGCSVLLHHRTKSNTHNTSRLCVFGAERNRKLSIFNRDKIEERRTSREWVVVPEWEKTNEEKWSSKRKTTNNDDNKEIFYCHIEELQLKYIQSSLKRPRIISIARVLFVELCQTFIRLQLVFSATGPDSMCVCVLIYFLVFRTEKKRRTMTPNWSTNEDDARLCRICVDNIYG